MASERKKNRQGSEGSGGCGANLCDRNPAAAAWAVPGNIRGTMNYNEAIQGCCNDCYFIAALSSVAWAAPAELDLWNTYYFSGQQVTLGHEEVPVDAAGKPVFAQLPPSSERWAMLYEVAYAKWRNNAHPDKPDIAATIGAGGSGFQALKEITGYQYPANAFLTDDPVTVDTIWGNIATGGLYLKGTYETYKTLYPSFAETRAALGSITGIYSSHTYSLFGKVKDKTTGKRYIVLRNPYAGQKPEPTSDVIAPGISFFGVALSATTDGVFALELSKFKQYFGKYGSVRNIP